MIINSVQALPVFSAVLCSGMPFIRIYKDYPGGWSLGDMCGYAAKKRERVKKMLKKIGKVLVGVAGVGLAMVSQASALPLVDVSSIAVDTSMLGTIGGVCITGLAAIWGYRKVVKSINRS